MKNYLYVWGMVMFALGLAGCATSTVQQVPEADLSASVDKDKSRIILHRDVGAEGCSHKIYDGAQYIGILGARGVMSWDRVPGTMVLKAAEEDGFCNDRTITLNLKSGETYVFDVNTTGGERFVLKSGKVLSDADIAKMKEQKERQELEDKQKQDILALEKENDLKGLKEYTDKNPDSVYYISDPAIRLALTGPKGMKVGDIRKLLKEGRSESIVISLIKRVKEPYKEFTIDEIDILLDMGLPDNVVAAMIDVTTKILENKEKRAYQEYLLAEQRKISKGNNGATTIINNTTVNQSSGESNTLQDELINQGAKKLLDHFF